MLARSGQGDPDGARKSPFLCCAGMKRNEKMADSSKPKSRSADADGRVFHKRGRKADSSDTSAPTRRDRVEEARRKKQNGDYDSQEVYRKIAERLLDLFGI